MNEVKFVKVDGDVRLHITDVGMGKPVVLVHGWPENDEIFRNHYILPR
jgi:non-heme chloroperoxidase